MSDASAGRWIAYSFAVVRVVPHPHLGTCTPVGVLLHARTEEFLGVRIVTDPERLAATVPEVDPHLLSRYLRALEAITRGDPEAGPVALTPTSERFHWLTAPRSDVIQCGAVHSGLCLDPAAALADLFASYVGTGP